MSVESTESEKIQDLKKEIETLKRLNRDLNVENERLTADNQALRKTVDEFEETFKAQNDHVTSLRDLAIQDREWLDLKISFRQSRLMETKKKTAAAKRRASNMF